MGGRWLTTSKREEREMVNGQCNIKSVFHVSHRKNCHNQSDCVQDFVMRYWQEQGAPVEKLNMGFATYGRTFRTSAQSSPVGAPSLGPAAAGLFTREAGFWSYYEVTAMILLCSETAEDEPFADFD